MNIVTLIGRLTRDPERRQTTSGLAVVRFGMAIDRGKDKNGESKGADFPTIVAFGKTGEVIERYVKKGERLGIQGHLHTDKYEKDGRTIFTTDVIVDRVEFLSGGRSDNGAANVTVANDGANGYTEEYQRKAEEYLRDSSSDFEAADDDELPF